MMGRRNLKPAWDAAVECVRLATSHVDASVAPAVAPSDDGDLQGVNECMRLLFSRPRAWLRTLCKLDEPVHFQAIYAASRAMFETLVDLILVGSSENDRLCAQMVAWEKRKHLEELKMALDAFRSPSGIIHSQGLWIHEWLQTNENAIMEATRKMFPRKPPQRWTGHQLNKDVERAANRLKSRGDGPCSEKNPLGAFPLLHSYMIHYKVQCMATHGASMALLRDLSASGITRLAIEGMLLCCELGTHTAKEVLKACGHSGALESLRSLVLTLRHKLLPHKCDLMTFRVSGA